MHGVATGSCLARLGGVDGGSTTRLWGWLPTVTWRGYSRWLVGVGTLVAVASHSITSICSKHILAAVCWLSVGHIEEPFGLLHNGCCHLPDSLAVRIW